MPTQKPRIQAIISVETQTKLKALCEKEHRTESNLVSLIIEEYINTYETKHGEIDIKKD